MTRPVSTLQANNLKEIVGGLRDHFREAIRTSGAAATGEGGFEGLVARLLAAQTGLPFVTASSGLQQTGDAQDDSGHISVQCKAYFGDSNPTVVEILGDAAVQTHVNKDLEVYVLVLRKATAQISNLKSHFCEHGLDFVLIQCVDDHPELPCLLTRHWDLVNDHPLLCGLPQHITNNLVSLNRTDTALVERTLVGLDKRIEHALGTYELCRSRSQDYLKKRFFSHNHGSRVGLYPIDLATATPRPESSKGFRDWWEAGSKPLLFVEGEEGFGKSWLIAQEVWNISHAGQAVVLWLDSNQWTDADTLRTALFAAFQYCLSFPDTESGVLVRLYRKLLNRWNRPVLLVLDGMNERDCATSATRIVTEFVGMLSTRADDGRSQDNALRPRDAFPLRIVFTTRPRVFRGNPKAVAGERGTYSLVPAYTDSEFAHVLRASSLSPDDLPPDANRILRTPRLFSAFLRVRTLIPKSQVITPALIWWYDLIQKIRDGLDPAITDGLQLNDPKDAEDLLCKIVRTLGSASTIPSEALTRLFSRDYPSIRADLAESRLFKDAARTSATISDDHVALAWGLILFRYLRGCIYRNVPEIADEILKSLEPEVSDPRRTDGILVALQLSVAENIDLPDEAVAAGLLAWFCSHNIHDRRDHLGFWCQQRLSAYSRFIENVLVSPGSGAPEKIAVSPLARLWRNGPEREGELAVILRRWMLVTWSEGQPADISYIVWGGIQLPVVTHQEQLRLTPIALSILSQHPVQSMLPVLAECLASSLLATEPHGETRFPVKWPHSMLEPLMRWNYSEDVVPVLIALRDGETRADVKEAFKWLIADGLGITKTQERDHRQPASVEMAILEHSDPRVYRPDNARCWVHDMARLAVRDDLPVIVLDAQTEMLDLFQSSFTIEKGSIDTWFFNALWPWALKHDPSTFEQACSAPLQKTLLNSNGPNYEILHHFQCLLWHTQREMIRDAIETCLRNNRDRLCFFTVEFILEWLLFHGPDDLLRRGLVCLENLRDRRGHLLIDLMSTTELLRMLKPECVVTLARESAIAISAVPEWRDNTEMRSRLEYWLLLWANATGEDEFASEWAINLLINDCPDQCRHDIIRLMSRSAGSRLPSLIQDRANLSACLSNDDILYMLRFGHLSANTRQEMRQLWARKGTHQIVHLGQLLLLRGDADGFRTWGHELLLLACKCAGALEQDTIPIATHFELDLNGCICSRGPVYSSGKSTVSCIGPNTWGLDEGVQPGHKGALDTQFEQWRDSEMSLRKWEGFPLRDFSDESSLRAWADHNPAEFRDYCNRFFTGVLESQTVVIKFGAFPLYLLATMLRVYPAEAYSFWLRLRKISINSVSIFGADLVTATAWEADASEISNIEEIRKLTLFHAKNDEEIMWLALCAVGSGTEQKLLGICKDALCSLKSKERALAVSVLAWTSDPTGCSLLADLCLSDPSSWIREHATWALDVQKQDAACRRAYRRVLEMENELEVSRQLHIMKPALMPSCFIWRTLEEQVASFPGANIPSRNVALIRHFWSHWDNVSNHQRDTRVLGRRMTEYLRGHKVDHFSETQMAPWWEP